MDFTQNLLHEFWMLAKSWHKNFVDELSAPLILDVESLGETLASFSLIDSGSKSRNSIS